MTTYCYDPVITANREIRVLALHPGNSDDEVTISLQHRRLRLWDKNESTLESQGSQIQDDGEHDGNNVAQVITTTATKDTPTLRVASQKMDGTNIPDVDHDDTAEYEHDTTGIDWDSYQALSYAWGSEQDPQPIFVKHAPTKNNKIMVTRDLLVALLHLRHSSDTLVLWIDAICIDQHNLKERSEQVALMGDIYRLSSHTIIWLGPGENDSALGFELMNHISEMISVNLRYHTMEPSAEALALSAADPSVLLYADATRQLDLEASQMEAIYEGVLARCWFQRLWVRQEAYLSCSKTFVCGKSAITWDNFVAAFFSVWAKPKGAVRNARYYITINGLIHQFLSHTVFKIHLYYTKTPSEVYEDAAARQMVLQNRIQILDSCEIASISLPGLPTWVPDWSTPIKPTINIEPSWSASAWISPAGVEYPGGGILRVRGIRVSGNVRPLKRFPTQFGETYNRYLEDAFLAVKDILACFPRESLEESYEHLAQKTRFEALCLLLQGGRVAEITFPISHKSLVTLEGATSSLRAILTSETWEALRSERHSASLDDITQFLSKFARFFFGRSLFVTEPSGYIGAGPACVTEGDRVSVLLGLTMPLLLRKATGSESDGWAHAMYDKATETFGMNPGWILTHVGFAKESISYRRSPHLFEVAPEEFVRRGINLQTFELV
ncbi:heterokaryon incompatibility protein-domain-containing protein [Podospora australis]|uniref:Heterokaryon incompatibility protein-domain-containing protein n=1 Tax=Podospora australis TaxID=1536484 RepID=A0AAN7AEQ6_9PEZI|nr:heterokaryon incompatibility protein-domain-containing protein [Podospora australis]